MHRKEYATIEGPPLNRSAKARQTAKDGNGRYCTTNVKMLAVSRPGETGIGGVGSQYFRSVSDWWYCR
jgi:hypothetical protein